MNKHAYLIIAHKDDLTFRTLLHMIDDSRNDIFIHMDVKNETYNRQILTDLVNNANVYHTPRINVTWGGGESDKCRNVAA